MSTKKVGWRKTGNFVMPIVNRLIDIYQRRGFLVSTGLNPCHFENFKTAPFTWLIKEGKNHTDGLGISTQEIYFLECLFEEFAPQNIFIIGNSFGWSTLAMSLLNPAAQIVAIDSGFSKNSLDGIDFTNRQRLLEYESRESRAL